MKNIHLLTNADLKRVQKLCRLLEKALVELIELKNTNLPRKSKIPDFQPAETDLVEEQSFIEYQLSLFPLEHQDH